MNAANDSKTLASSLQAEAAADVLQACSLAALMRPVHKNNVLQALQSGRIACDTFQKTCASLHTR